MGRDASRGGWSRHGWDDADLQLRAWFEERAGRSGLEVQADSAGNLWAWWGDPAGEDVVVTGSHLDSVPGGGAFDGPLGVLSALHAVERLRAGGLAPRRPVAVVAFAEEEGGRFGVPCLGSRLLTGELEPDRARSLRDVDGTTLAEALQRAGTDPVALAADPGLVARVGDVVELHVEQGRGLSRPDTPGGPVAVASSLLAHGRWRVVLRGRRDHAGTALLDDRRDAALPAARLVLAARDAARRLGGRATVGRVRLSPGGTNVVADLAEVWLDLRHDDDDSARALLDDVLGTCAEAAAQEGVDMVVREESWSPRTTFDPGLTSRVRAAAGADVPLLASGAGHDAGVLAAHTRAAMLFVRNRTGVSHAPDEHAEVDDCLAGVDALAAVLADLVRDGTDPVTRA